MFTVYHTSFHLQSAFRLAIYFYRPVEIREALCLRKKLKCQSTQITFKTYIKQMVIKYIYPNFACYLLLEKECLCNRKSLQGTCL